MRKALLVALLFGLAVASGSRAQEQLPVSVNDLGGNQAMFHFDVNGESVAVLLYCGTGMPYVAVSTPQGTARITEGVICTDTFSAISGVNYSQVNFSSAETVTIGSQTITINPASFTEKAVRAGRTYQWAMVGYSAAISAD